MELVRSRLTEIYDKDFVDRLIPFKEELLYWNNTECIYFNKTIMIFVVIQDVDLKRMG